MPNRIGVRFGAATAVLVAACSTEPCELLPSHGIEAEVRTLAGAPAAEGATAEAHRAGQSEQLERINDLVFLGVDEPGTYRLTVTKPGYRPAEVDGIRVHGNDCSVETTTVRVNLLPE